MAEPSTRHPFAELPDILNGRDPAQTYVVRQPIARQPSNTDAIVTDQGRNTVSPPSRSRPIMAGSSLSSEPNPRTRKPETPKRIPLAERLSHAKATLDQPGENTPDYVLQQRSTAKSGNFKQTGKVKPVLPFLDPEADNQSGPITQAGVIAVNRFGLGAKPGELALASVDPKDWLKRQLQQPANGGSSSMMGTRDCMFVNGVFDYSAETQPLRNAAISKLTATRGKFLTPGIPRIDDSLADWIDGQLWFFEIRTRDYFAATSNTPLLERLTRFWSNHFSIHAVDDTIQTTGAFERDVCRRHLTGKFSDMYVAAILHPAMLLYLDNENSVGKNAPWGDGVNGSNENLAREAMELHSLGVNGGYTQEDVIQLADALSGHSIGWPWEDWSTPARYFYKRQFHEPGARQVLGKTYAADNDTPRQAVRILQDIARHPSTIDFICRKLAKHFIADTPPEAVVQSMKAAWTANDGLLLAVYHALIDHPLSWSSSREKVKTPAEYFISTARALGTGVVFGLDQPYAEWQLWSLWEDMGQFPLSSPSPQGWSDDAYKWAKPAAMMTRMQWADVVARRLFGTRNPIDLIDNYAGMPVSGTTRTAINEASSFRQGITMALSSPEFQRR